MLASSFYPSKLAAPVRNYGILYQPPAINFDGRMNGMSMRKREKMTMRIVPCSKKKMRVLVPRQVTTQQWAAYWGMNQKERLQKILESVLVAYGGAWMAWFLSFMAGSLVSAFAGTGLVFNWMYTPWLSARKRNAKFWPSGQRLNYALFDGRVKR